MDRNTYSEGQSMKPIYYVTGQAGTGKTTWLMDKALELSPTFITAKHHSLLAITWMHGARRRIQKKLRDSLNDFSFSVSTIDGFALSILNRWRTTLGYSLPIQAVNSESDFTESLFGTEASFERIRQKSTLLLHSLTIQRIVNESYPLILIDEFQDCHGSLLEFVKALSECSVLLLAADEFQLLDSTIVGCPGLAWIHDLQGQVSVQHEELTEFHRTSNQNILEAARCLRENTPAKKQTIPVVCCPRHQAAAWKIIDHLVLGWYSPPCMGTCALICPSYDSFLRNVLDSCRSQLQKRNRDPIRWHEEHSIEEAQARTASNLGLTTATRESDCSWQVPSGPLDGFSTCVINRVQRFARLRGINTISHRLVSRHADMAVHEQRAYRSPSASRTVTTVHGAKNREFSSVFILWNPFSVRKWNSEDQRRLLYNAITRSAHYCMVLVLGDENKARKDPVLALLGPPESAFSQKKTKKEKRTKRKVS
ncbi:UvrD-helicase domain-containing protein [Planctomycetota bacterium]